MAGISKGTVRKNVFQTIWDIVDSNSEWDVLAAFPEADPVFPCIVINPVKVSIEKVTVKNCFTYQGTIDIEFFDYKSNKKTSIDAQKDIISAIFTNSDKEESLFSDGFIFDSISVDDTNTAEFGGKRLNTGILRIKFEVK